MALAQVETLTNYIPRAVLFKTSEVLMVKISPDGQYLSYVKGEDSGVMNIHICKTTECDKDSSLRQITHFTTPEIYRFFWTDDSKNIVFLQDTDGSKRYDLYGVNILTNELTNYTQRFKSSAKIFKVSGNKVAIGINDRNPKFHDIFILDTSTGNIERVFENDKFSRFTLNNDLQIVLKEEIHDDGSIDIYKDDALYMHLTAEDAFHTRMLSVQNNNLYILDSRNSNTTWLKQIDLSTNAEFKLAHDEKSDIGDIVFINGVPQLYATEWLYKEWHTLGSVPVPALKDKFAGSFQVVSQAMDNWIIRVDDPKRIGASFYLYNLATQKITPLYETQTHPDLVDMHGFEFTTRDGLVLTGYITLPKNLSLDNIKKPVPLIVKPHGGPFQARDQLGYNSSHQWLANRGYAVVSVNFRLSSGLGKDLVNAGNGEWGGKAQNDLIDAVQWCIAKGITTKEQVGIMGASYGGYATLAALTFTPDVFAVGVDLVGPSSLITVMQNVPKYWDFPSYALADGEHFFTRGAFIKSMGGSPDDSAGREFLATRSPLNFAEQITSPLLIIQGDNDPIVTKIESEQIFNKLKSLGKRACFLSFPDEGHRINRYANIDVYLAAAEKWLHDSLGGIYEPVVAEQAALSSVNKKVSQ